VSAMHIVHLLPGNGQLTCSCSECFWPCLETPAAPSASGSQPCCRQWWTPAHNGRHRELSAVDSCRLQCCRAQRWHSAQSHATRRSQGTLLRTVSIVPMKTANKTPMPPPITALIIVRTTQLFMKSSCKAGRQNSALSCGSRLGRCRRGAQYAMHCVCGHLGPYRSNLLSSGGLQSPVCAAAGREMRLVACGRIAACRRFGDL
jgi:hypothetical protein